MKEFFTGLGMGLAAGLLTGGIVVARNKKLSNKINDGLDMAEEKLEDAKNAIAKKLKNCKCEGENSQNLEDCGPSSKVCR